MHHSTSRHARSLWILCIVCFAGCARGPALNAGISSGPQVEIGAAGGNRLSGVAEFKLAQRSSVPIPIAEAWTRLVKAYSDLGIPLTTVSPNDHFLGNEGMRRTHTFAGQRLSSLLDCGIGGTGGGANADIYSVNMSVVTRLAVSPDSTTEIATLVQATATPMSFGTAAVACSTNGWLESKISSMVNNRK